MEQQEQEAAVAMSIENANILIARVDEMLEVGNGIFHNKEEHDEALRNLDFAWTLCHDIGVRNRITGMRDLILQNHA